MKWGVDRMREHGRPQSIAEDEVMSHPFSRRVAPALALSIAAVVVAYLPSASPPVDEFVATSQPILAQLSAKEGKDQVIAEERGQPATAAPVAMSQPALTQLPTKEDQVIGEERAPPATAAPVAASQPALTQLPANESKEQVITEERAPPATAAPITTSQPALAQLPAKESEDQLISEERYPPAAVATNYPRAESGRRVHVEAPYTSVRVNPDRGRVRVRAPFVDLDIRW
jgi:hypothetical protein